MAISNNVQMALAAVNKIVVEGGVWGERERNEGGGFAFNIHILDVLMENLLVIK